MTFVRLHKQSIPACTIMISYSYCLTIRLHCILCCRKLPSAPTATDPDAFDAAGGSSSSIDMEKQWKSAILAATKDLFNVGTSVQRQQYVVYILSFHVLDSLVTTCLRLLHRCAVHRLNVCLMISSKASPHTSAYMNRQVSACHVMHGHPIPDASTCSMTCSSTHGGG